MSGFFNLVKITKFMSLDLRSKSWFCYYSLDMKPLQAHKIYFVMFELLFLEKFRHFWKTCLQLKITLKTLLKKKIFPSHPHLNLISFRFSLNFFSLLRISLKIFVLFYSLLFFLSFSFFSLSLLSYAFISGSSFGYFRSWVP